MDYLYWFQFGFNPVSRLNLPWFICLILSLQEKKQEKSFLKKYISSFLFNSFQKIVFCSSCWDRMLSKHILVIVLLFGRSVPAVGIIANLKLILLLASATMGTNDKTWLWSNDTLMCLTLLTKDIRMQVYFKLVLDSYFVILLSTWLGMKTCALGNLTM